MYSRSPFAAFLYSLGTIAIVAALKRKRYTARICWNSNSWTFPSGEASHLEKGSYVVDSGFGHEEWLFNFAWNIQEFHYAFLQPVNKSFANVAGETIDVLLYTINAAGDRLYVGEIRNCEVIQLAQAQDALRIYKRRGWLKSMAEQVADIGGEVEKISEGSGTDLFNIRFRQVDADIYDPPVIADRKDVVWVRQRYTLVLADEKIEKQWRSRVGNTTPPLIRTINRKGVPGLTYDPIHKRLQADLLRLLEGQYGKGNVTLEMANVDITVRDIGKTLLIEIKTNPNPRAAIREAIGQLLEYAYYWPRKGIKIVELVIIAPGKLDTSAKNYIQRLQTKFGIPIAYDSHSEDGPLPALFAK